VSKEQRDRATRRTDHVGECSPIRSGYRDAPATARTPLRRRNVDQELHDLNYQQLQIRIVSTLSITAARRLTEEARLAFRLQATLS
jgi:hypothetical protein